MLEDRQINDHQIYKRIIFIDKKEGVIVDTLPESEKGDNTTNWNKYLRHSEPEPRIVMEQDAGRSELIASIPYYFKDNYQGQILAWIRPYTLYHLVEAAQALSRRSFFITCLEGRSILPPPSRAQGERPEPPMPDLSEVPVGRMQVFAQEGGGAAKWLAFRVQVSDTPLCIMTVIPAAEVSTGMAQWYVPAGMGLIAVLILGGMLTAYRINTQRLILGARLDESSKSQEKITEKNRQLRREIAVRRQAEEALRRINLDLEERVKERTADLTLAVGQLEKEIEERKEIEGRLRVSEERMRHLIESAPVGISINQGGRFVYANPAFVRMYGYEDAEEVLGLPVESTVAPEERELLWKRRAARLRGEGPPYSFEIKALRKSGEPFEAAVLGTPIDYEGDKAVLAFMIDMSVEKQLRSQLQQAQKMEALGTLAGGIAHDFNNILSAIIGYTELAKHGISPGGAVEDDLDRVLKSAERAKNLVKQILTFSRRTDEEQKPLQPVLIVKEALK
ncbi:MAG: PAS domain S-box protein, partial [Desulfobacteraceae bacterium]